MGTLAAAAILIAWRKGGGEAVGQGLKDGGSLFVTILPNLIFGFMLAGMMQVLIPKELVTKWLGAGSGINGLVVGTILGTITPGGPFSQFPLVASMWKMGATPGPLAAYLTAWSLLGINRVIVYEYPFMGPTFTAIHLSVCLFAPPLIGAAVGFIFQKFV